MKRVLIFSLNYYPLVGGAEIAIKEITDRIVPEEIEFHMITLRYDAYSPVEERMGNVYVHRVGKGVRGVTFSETFASRFYMRKVLFVPLAVVKAFSLRKKYRFDGAWTMMTYMVFPIVLLRLFGITMPYLLTLQEGDPFERVFERTRIRLFSPLLLYGIRHASAVQAISNFLARWARRSGYEGILEVIPNGMDVAHFSHAYTPEELQGMRGKLGKKEGDIFLVTTSRLVHKNAIDDVIRALPLLPENVSFLIYGIGPDEEKLRALAKELNVEDRARFLGQIGHDTMPLAMKACDIFIRPSRSEGMGNSFVEAMALRMPVIATQEGGIADFLFDEKRNPDKPTTGWAVDRDSPEQIAEAVKDILARPEKVEEVTKTASAMVIEKYDWDTVAKAMFRLFESLFDGRLKSS